jgi:hypothetical protein
MSDRSGQQIVITDHCLVVEEVRERLAVSKQKKTHTLHMERFDLKKLNQVEGKEEYHVEISNRFTCMENLHDEKSISESVSNATDYFFLSSTFTFNTICFGPRWPFSGVLIY